MSELTIDAVEPSGTDFAAALALYREYRKTLGFLPEGAFKQFAEEGRLLVARADGGIVAYLAYRLAGDEAVLVHLCVSAARRGEGIAGALLDALLKETQAQSAVRLSCRRDYEEANRLWPKYGFRCVGEKEGRGHDRAPLYRWRRQHSDDEPLLSRLHDNVRETHQTVAVDANVFMDFYSDTQQAEESKSLLADWLESEIVICVTGELSNEISRNSDIKVRIKRRSQMTNFLLLEAPADEFRTVHDRVVTLLPTATTERDESDRRQLAHAAAKGADFFVTRDDTLLRHADALQGRLGVRVLRPTDLVAQIHSDQDPVSYSPARLVGTQIHERAPAGEAEFLPFQGFAQSETKGAYLAICRLVLTDPTRYKTRVVAPSGEDPIVLFSVDISIPGEPRIVLARSLSHRLSPTVLRRVISERLAHSQAHEGSNLYCDDLADPVVLTILDELGFRAEGASRVKTSLRGVVLTSDLPAMTSVPAGLRHAAAADLERLLWPLKISDGGVESFIVPIKPHWAAQLFDVELADRDLFGADISLALALENVYYSGSPIQIPEGARILWYVSTDERERIQALRACSLNTATMRGAARDVFRRFRRLGAYKWRDVVGLTGGDAHSHVTAYRFAFTERLRTPIGWRRLQEILEHHVGHRNPIAGPVRVPSAVFDALYSEATHAES